MREKIQFEDRWHLTESEPQAEQPVDAKKAKKVKEGQDFKAMGYRHVQSPHAGFQEKKPADIPSLGKLKPRQPESLKKE